MKTNTLKPTEAEKPEKLIYKKNWVTPELQILDIDKTESGVTYSTFEEPPYMPRPSF